MIDKIEKITKIVKDAENQFEATDKNNVDAMGMLNITLTSIDITLRVAMDSEQNYEHRDIYRDLLDRIENLRKKANL